MIISFGRFRYKYQPNWKLTLTYLVMMPLLLGLGFWQLDRAAYKATLLYAFEQRMKSLPVALAEAIRVDGPEFTQVTAQGLFDNERLFLIDNKVVDGRVGYELVSGFQLAEPIIIAAETNEIRVERVWVNRGWVPQGRTRQDLPEVTPITGEVTINGMVRRPSRPGISLAPAEFSGRWPEVIQEVDFNRLAERGQVQNVSDHFPYLVNLSAASPGALQVEQGLSMTGPEKHLGYAFQWFLMAAALTILYIAASTRRIKNSED